MDRNDLKKEIRQEVIAEIMPVYIAEFEKLKAKARIVAEKEKIYDELFKDYFDMLVANRALKQAKRELANNNQ